MKQQETKALSRLEILHISLTIIENFSQIKQLIESGENVNQVDKNGETPLIIASCLGYTEVLLYPFFHFIIHHLLTKIVSALLESQDVAINNKTPEGWTALVAAADKGHHGLVRTLLKHQGTDVNIRDNQSK